MKFYHVRDTLDICLIVRDTLDICLVIQFVIYLVFLNGQLRNLGEKYYSDSGKQPTYVSACTYINLIDFKLTNHLVKFIFDVGLSSNFFPQGIALLCIPSSFQ